MAKRSGRKRKMTLRQPNGQPKRDYSRDTGTKELARKMQAMKGKGTLALVTDRMAAMGLLTDQQNQAAALHRWLREKAYGRPAAPIAGYAEMISEGTLRPIADIDPDRDPQARAEAAYRKGHKLVIERGRPGAAAELTRVVIDNFDPIYRDYEGLCEALDLLAGLYFSDENQQAA